MSNLNRFLKKNKVVKPNQFYAPTKSLQDENGAPMPWEFKAITTKQDEAIREECTTEVQVTGKPGMFRQKQNTNAYLAKMVAACVVEPNLLSAELQDSYGVMKPEDLLKEMVNEPGEYQDLMQFVQSLNGYTSMNEKVEEAKN